MKSEIAMKNLPVIHLLAAAALGLASCSRAQGAGNTSATNNNTADSSMSDQKPNVVIMLSDNVGYGDIGAYGAGEIRGMPTPRIDQLASEGLRLTQFFV